jgi:hypothetical protein
MSGLGNFGCGCGREWRQRVSVNNAPSLPGCNKRVLWRSSSKTQSLFANAWSCWGDAVVIGTGLRCSMGGAESGG